ncbi:3-isopropylmalate dehydrogenase [Myroides pelagicus]|uniref:3-isopropylmalate dehydrogenase n=1 Tax=Myroides pelagicus TaxID=270914 RepID=A0A7K1GM45_9FLAO|nr:3-isopropylmalate dehydrogenase [Myroides pelagicus]MEC4113140.1 3-isopropylmalate dehydrogenase [Myroides pelagicus]MTH29810.1 3-isopropylmalate dehydrogenase [Myroides pelagicus]
MTKNYQIAVLSGDGIGPEVINETIKVLDAVAQTYVFELQYQQALIGAIAIDQTNEPLPLQTIEACKQADAVLFGAIGDPKYDNDPNAAVRPEQGLLALRKELGLFANVRPVKAYKKLLDKSPLRTEIIQHTDLIIFRELISGIYFGDKKISSDGRVATDTCTYTQEEIENIAHLAFQSAVKRNNKLTLIDKANVLETSRLWRRVVQSLATQYPTVEVDYMFVDNAAMQLILNPKQFDVILTENMFGDIISDEASVIGGSIGLLPSASIGDKTALFEPIHGSYPQAKNKGIANPIASILSGAMMLDHLGEHDAADAIRDAVLHAINQGILTPDLATDTTYTTNAVGDHIANHVRYRTGHRYQDNMTHSKSTII